METEKIRNFCIIAHIDHGKSTLADRFLELTNTVPKEKMRNQYLDQMDLEKERGITIKLQPVRMKWKGYELNLIDTPGHVDFTYEVSRSLKSVEGAILLVDATQGIEAQTLSNLHLAMQQDLKIIPAVNKIDSPQADAEKVVKSVAELLKIHENEVMKVSAKTGQGVGEILDEIIKRVPAPANYKDSKRALIFDSQFDDYKGVIVFVRVFGGEFRKGESVLFLSTNTQANIIEVGAFHPERIHEEKLQDGQIGYLITTLKSAGMCSVGDTVTDPISPGKALPGYREVKPMVYAGVFANQDDFGKLKASMEKLSLSDPSIKFESENSPSLGFGFRVGFLGLLHMEIIIERLKREFSVQPIITPPSVSYRVNIKAGDRLQSILIKSPLEMPSPEKIISTEEPWLEAQIVTVQEYIGPVMSLFKNTRAKYVDTVYLSQDRAIIKYHMPLRLLLKGFYDKLKSISQGYASLNYDLMGWVETKLEKLDILAQGAKIPEMTQLVYPEEAYSTGRRIVETLKEEIPPQQFEIKLQAAVGSKIIASETKKALRKDVTAKLYGGDVTRKMKLLKKQKRGKKKMAFSSAVEIPTKAYLAVYRKA